MDKKALAKRVYINPDDIPAMKKASFDWKTEFGEIPSGKTRVFSDEVKYCTVSQALKRLQKVGMFRNYRVQTRTHENKRTTYVTNLPTK